MRRRDFITVLGTAVAAPALARADDAALPVIGFLNGAWPEAWANRVAAFRAGLSELGYVEGRNVKIEYRWAEGDSAKLPALASDLAAHRVDVIAATGGTHVARVAQRAGRDIPIVFTMGADPVASGLVATYNRPGGNITGITMLSGELAAKRLEVLHDLAPRAQTIALLVNPTSDLAGLDIESVSAAAQRLGLHVSVLKVGSDGNIDLAFAELTRRRVEALLVDSNILFERHRDHLAALAARDAIPTLFDTRNYPEAGGLASYGPDYALAYRQAGVYVARILRGAKPADLPVVQLSKIELVINAKAATKLGLTIPPAILTRADEIIE